MDATSDYLEDSGIAFFLHDAVAQILKSRPKRPLEEIHRYFKQVQHGDHVVAREFAFVQGTLRNRGAFVQAVGSSFPQVPDEDEFPLSDLLQFCRFVCFDFPETLLRQGVAAVGADPARPVRFGTFRSRALPWFMYHELIEMLRVKFGGLALDAKGNNRPIEPQDHAAFRTARCLRLELLHAAIQACYESGRRPKSSCYPPVDTLDQMLSGSSALAGWDDVLAGIMQHPYTRRLTAPTRVEAAPTPRGAGAASGGRQQ